MAPHHAEGEVHGHHVSQDVYGVQLGQEDKQEHSVDEGWCGGVQLGRENIAVNIVLGA